MKKSKRVLSLLMVLAMVVSLLVVSNATVTQEKVGPGNYSSGEVKVVGQDTLIPITDVSTSLKFYVSFVIYMDPATYLGTRDFSLIFPTYDETIFTSTKALPAMRLLDDQGDYSTKSAILFSGNNYINIGYLGDDSTNKTSSDLGTDGFALQIDIEFSIIDVDKFKAQATHQMSMGVKTNNNSTSLDFSGYLKSASGSQLAGVAISDPGLFSYAPATIKLTGPTVTYDLAGGSRANNMDAFKPAIVGVGLPFTPADGRGLTLPATGGNNPKVFDYWSYGSNQKYYPEAGGTVTMASSGVVMTAVYSDDKDGDGYPDTQENKVTYKLRDGDSGVLVPPSGATANGTFFAEGSNQIINVIPNEKIRDSIVTVDLTNVGPAKWKFVGYYINGTKYTPAELANYTVTGATTVEVRTMPDDNDNDIDDREKVTLNFYAPGANPATAKPLETYKVLDNTPYTVYKDPIKTTGTAIKGNADADPTNVVLPTIPDKYNGGVFKEWVFEPVLDGNGEITEVKVHPVYSENREVLIPDVIEDPNVSEEPEDVTERMDIGTKVIHRDINGNTLKETPITEGSSVLNVVHPVVGTISTLPSRDSNGNPFKGWILTGPNVNAQTGDVTYYLDPYYAKPTKLTVTNPKDAGTTTDDVILPNYNNIDVPVDSTYEIQDDKGNVTEQGKVEDKNGKVTLPTTDKLPARDDEGRIFTGDWTDEVVVNNDGSKHYVFKPVYREPGDGDIDIKVDESVNNNGNGLTVLKGFYDQETIATVKYYVNIANTPAVASDAARLNVVEAAANGFDALTNASVVIGNTDSLVYKGTETRGGVVYGVFEAKYNTVKSGIVSLKLQYKSVPIKATAKGYTVVTVGDLDKNTYINAADIGDLARYVNKILTEPQKGATGNFVYELSDVDKNSVLNASDIGVVARMVNGIIISN